ncbi:MAG: hypothetical protein A2Z20_00010, partial [Bdellovibrionales bacterium RBG_16_40_8]
MGLLYFYLILTLTTSFVCSLSEAVILSVSPAFVGLLKKKGHLSGKLLHKLHKSIDRPLAAILTFNTIAATVGSIMIGHQVNIIFDDSYLAASSVILTFVILVFSEIMPKILGSIHAKRLAPVVAYVVTAMVYLSLPIVYISRIMSRILMPSRRKRTSREEMIVAAEISVDEGVLQLKESRVIKNLLMLDKIKVLDIMTPRSVVNAFDMNDTVDSVMQKYKPVRFSRIPIYDGSVNNIVGLLHRYKLMEAVSHDMYNMQLKDIMTSVHRISEDTSVSAALDQFIKRREHLFLVTD